MKRVFIIMLMMAGMAGGQTFVRALRYDIPVYEPTRLLLKSIHDDTTSWGIGNIISNNYLIDFSPDRVDMAMVDGKALMFDGGGDYVSRDITGKPFGDCTLSCWFNTDNIDILPQIFSQSGNNTYLLYLDSNGVLIINDQEASSALAINTDYFVEAKYDAGGTGLVVRIDGVETWSGIAAGGTIGNTFYVGSDGSGYAFFSGKIWDVQVTGENGFRWPMQEGPGADDILYDVSGNGRDGELKAESSSVETIRGGTQSQSFYGAEYGMSKVTSYDGTAYGIVDNSTNLFNVGINDFTISGRLTKSVTPDGNKYFFGKYETTPDDKREWAMRFEGTSGDLELGTSSTGANIKWNTVLAANIPSGWFEFSVTKSGEDTSWTTNGAPVPDTDTILYANVNDADGPITIGSIGGDNANGSYEGQIAWIEMTSGGVTCRWDSAVSYGTNLVSSTGCNDAMMTSNKFAYIPALADGTADAEDGPITNLGGLAHHNGGHGVVVGGITNTFADLLTNAIYNASINSVGLIEEFYE